MTLLIKIPSKDKPILSESTWWFIQELICRVNIGISKMMPKMASWNDSSSSYNLPLTYILDFVSFSPHNYFIKEKEKREKNKIKLYS